MKGDVQRYTFDCWCKKDGGKWIQITYTILATDEQDALEQARQIHIEPDSIYHQFYLGQSSELCAPAPSEQKRKAQWKQHPLNRFVEKKMNFVRPLPPSFRDFTRATEAKLKEKNHG